VYTREEPPLGGDSHFAHGVSMLTGKYQPVRQWSNRSYLGFSIMPFIPVPFAAVTTNQPPSKLLLLPPPGRSLLQVVHSTHDGNFSATFAADHGILAQTFGPVHFFLQLRTALALATYFPPEQAVWGIVLSSGEAAHLNFPSIARSWCCLPSLAM
jgi:hypothetical protein